MKKTKNNRKRKKIEKPSKKSRKIKKKVFLIIGILLFWTFLVGVYHYNKPLPSGTSIEGEIYYVSDEDIDFLYDLTFFRAGEKVTEQEIFDKVFEMVDGAEKFILIDMFLFNSDYSENIRFKELATILKNKLIRKKELNPNIKINFITDEINNFYGSYVSDEIQELQDKGINVVITDMTKMRDSNPLYSSFWRTYLQWFGTKGKGWIKHPLGNAKQKITFRSLLKVFNAKANHRKIIIADKGDKIVSLVTSANPHEASSRHSNIAIYIEKEIWKDILVSEQAVAEFSDKEIEKPNFDFISEFKQEGDIQVQLLTEGKIRKNLIQEIDNTVSGESIDIIMFYLSERNVISSLINAAERGVEIRLILDPNKDAFAREKNGIPNRQVANDLIKESKGKIKILWYKTQGEQCHSKIIIIRKKNKTIIFLGSANLTKRNIKDFNLETDVRISCSSDKKITQEISAFFERIWNNENGTYVLPYKSFEENSFLKDLQYRFQETTGISTF